MIIRPLFILPDLRGGGAERVTLNVLRHLNPQRFAPTLFLLRREGVYWQEVPPNVRVVCATEKGRLGYHLSSVLVRLFAEARRSDVIVGALELIPTYLAALSGAALAKPSVGWVHTNLVAYVRSVAPRQTRLARFVYSRMRNLVFVSAGAAEACAEFIAAPALSGWRVIHNPFDPRVRGGRVEHAGQPRPPGLPSVLSVGRLDRGKGFDVLIRAHARLRDEGLQHRLVILGEGAERETLQRLVRALQVSDTVNMPGFVANLTPYLESATAFALASRYEGFGLALVEALAAGLPIVATDCRAGPAEILENGKYGVLVPPEDGAALAEGMRRLLTDPALRSRLAQRGPTRAADFSPQVIVRQWEALFEELI